MICFDFNVAADYNDDGEIFNGSVEVEEYVINTLIGAVIGGFLGWACGLTFTLSIPTMALIKTTAGTTALILSTSTVVISGEIIALGLGATTITIMYAKGNGPRMGHSHYENKQFKDLCSKYHLSKTDACTLHDYISRKNYTYREIEEIIIELFGRLVK